MTRTLDSRHECDKIVVTHVQHESLVLKTTKETDALLLSVHYTIMYAVFKIEKICYKEREMHLHGVQQYQLRQLQSHQTVTHLLQPAKSQLC